MRRSPAYVTIEARVLASTQHITLSVRLSTSRRSAHLDITLIWNPLQWKLHYRAYEDRVMSAVYIQVLCLAGDLATFNN